MKIEFINEYKEVVIFEVDVLTNDTFIKEKEEEMFKNFINNSKQYKIKVK